MLMLIDSTDEKQEAQSKLQNSFQSALKSQGQHTIGFRVGRGEKNPLMPVYSNGNGQIWFCSLALREANIPRYWNAFGLFDPSRPRQTISVELNIPIDTNNQQVAGFFARDSETGRVYLLHSGRVGGGRKGIGKNDFLACSRQVPEPVSVVDKHGHERLGIVLGQPGDRSIVAQVDAYVRRVADFKKLAANGALDTPEFREKVAVFNSSLDNFEQFNREFSGKKKGHRGKTLDYISRHGDIVNALHDKRVANVQTGERVFNTRLIDLGVKRGDKIVEVYEVKTGTGRQAIYTAVGQLVIHSGGTKQTRKVIVLPEEENLPNNTIEALSSIGIEVWRFMLQDDGSCDFVTP